MTPTLLQRLPACRDAAAPQRFTILGVLLLFGSQISQAARQVHYSRSGEDLWLRPHQPSPAREPGSPRQGCFGWEGRRRRKRGDPSRTPPGPPSDGHTAQAARQRLFSPLPRFSTPSRSRRGSRAARDPRQGCERPLRGLQQAPEGKPPSPFAGRPGRLSDAKARGYRQARTAIPSPPTPELGGPGAAVHLTAAHPHPGSARPHRGAPWRMRRGRGPGAKPGPGRPPVPADVADITAAALLVQEARPAVGRLHPALPRGAPVLPQERHGGGTERDRELSAAVRARAMRWVPRRRGCGRRAAPRYLCGGGAACCRKRGTGPAPAPPHVAVFIGTAPALRGRAGAGPEGGAGRLWAGPVSCLCVPLWVCTHK